VNVPSVWTDGVPDPLPAGVQVLDVREADEWVCGHIEGALHIPMMDLPIRMHELPEGRLLVVCKVGARSAQAAAYLVHHGHDAVNLAGGLLDWEAAGRPLVSETAQAPAVV
jgi:rhodanese-related sulfurtransferase